jgi:hypothetical protein
LQRQDLSLDKLPLKAPAKDNNVYILYWSAPFNLHEHEINSRIPNTEAIFYIDKNIYFQKFSLSQLIFFPGKYLQVSEKLMGEPYSFVWKIYERKK